MLITAGEPWAMGSVSQAQRMLCAKILCDNRGSFAYDALEGECGAMWAFTKIIESQNVRAGRALVML